MSNQDEFPNFDDKQNNDVSSDRVIDDEHFDAKVWEEDERSGFSSLFKWVALLALLLLAGYILFQYVTNSAKNEQPVQPQIEVPEFTEAATDSVVSTDTTASVSETVIDDLIVPIDEIDPEVAEAAKELTPTEVSDAGVAEFLSKDGVTISNSEKAIKDVKLDNSQSKPTPKTEVKKTETNKETAKSSTKVEPKPKPEQKKEAAKQESASENTAVSTASVKELPANQFAVQLVGAHNESDFKKFVAALPANPKLHTYTTQREGKDWHVAILAPYATTALAKEAINTLPEKVKANKPWVKSIKDIQAQLAQ